ncbi:MAG: anti-sigma factor [Acetobacteraceae bacterium]|nr:anti-sigma factor [Acetobacteraceae bacterium]
MECKRATELLHPLVDGELGFIARQRLLRHVGRCGVCARRLGELQALQTALRTGLHYHRAPPALAARIGTALSHEALLPETTPRRFGRVLRSPGAGFAATGLAGALAGAVLALLVSGSGLRPAEDVAGAVVDSHIRSLMPGHMIEVQTSDQHTVKPWLSQRVDVSPPVRDLAEEGFPLLGGRIDYVDGHKVASVVYRRSQHIISLLAWASPGAADEGFRTLSRRGFNVVTWRREGATYWAVSDVEAKELLDFAHRIAGDA